MIELDLAEAARERFDFAAAEGRYRRALELLAVREVALRMVALRGRGLVRMRVGRGAEALTDLVAATALAQELGDGEAQVGLLLEQATARDWNNDAPGAARLVAEAEAQARAAAPSKVVQAGLLLGRGRAQFREGLWAEAWSTLQEAVVAAERLGSAGFEPLLVSLILLEVLLPYLGRTPEAEAAAERAVSLARGRGDKLHLASALNNRRNLQVARKDLAAALADQRTFREIGREHGLSLNEYFAEYNLGELHYQAGELSLARPFAARAVTFEQWMPSIAPRPTARLLQARVAAFAGLDGEARPLLIQVEAKVEQARAGNRPEGLLLPSEQVLATMVDLATRDATEAEWDALVQRSTRDSIEQEPIEVLELRALSLHRRGQTEAARRGFDEALALAARIPNLLEGRILQARALVG